MPGSCLVHACAWFIIPLTRGVSLSNELHACASLPTTAAPADWVGDYGCRDNRIWVCGSFETNEAGVTFRNTFQKHYSRDQDMALVAVPDNDFCNAFPGAVVIVKSHDWPGKYDHEWRPTDGWAPNKCGSCDIDVTYTCPTPPPPPPKPTCNVCWEWTLSGCEDSYYRSDMCDQAVHKLEYVLQTLATEVRGLGR